MYKIPDEYFYRLHHVRPRFKGDIENVLFYVAHICSELKELPVKEYAEKMNQAIYLFPGNSGSVEKTINNWRTEIAALFGFYIEDKKSGNTKTGETAYFLDKTQDLVQFFKFYLFKFQYPGGHLKSNEIKNMIDAGIRFKPAQYILKMMNSYEIENERQERDNKKDELIQSLGWKIIRYTEDTVKNDWNLIDKTLNLDNFRKIRYCAE